MQLKNFGQYFRDNPVPMWIYDPEDYSIKDVNQAMAELHGYSREQMLSFTLFDLRPKEEIPKLKKHLAQMDYETVVDEGMWKHRKKNGEFIYAHVITNPVTYEGEDHTYQLAIYKDITGDLNTQLSNEMLFKNAQDGIMLTKPNGEILQANQAACQILGMTEEEITERGCEGLVAKDEKKKKRWKRGQKQGICAGELNFIHKDGHHIPVDITNSVFKNYAGEKRTILLFRDIRDRKQKEQSLRDERKFTKVLLSSLPGVFYVLDQEGKVVRSNEHTAKIFGISRDKIEGSSAENFIAEDDKGKLAEEIRTVLEEGYGSFEMTINTADGPAVHRFNKEKLEQDNQTYIVGIGVDITKQKELQEQLNTLLDKEQELRKKAETDRDKLTEMFEEAPSPKCVLEGPELHYVIANKAYRQQVVGEEDIVGKRVDEVTPEVEEQGYIDKLTQVYETGEPYLGRGEHIYIDKDDEDSKQEYIFNLLFAPLFDENGKVYGIFVEGLDYSEQIAYQKQLEQSLKEKETLLAEIHHRVKNNLAIITSMMQLQAMDTEKSELRDLLQVAQQRIQTIATIHELLYGAESLSQLNFGENVEQLLQNIKDMYSSSKKITVTVEADDIPMNINQAIPCALLVNEVVTNAYKHAFKNRQEGEIAVKLQENNEEVLIEVIDNGVGLPGDFVQEDASSIGMTLINKLTQQLEGEITFSNGNGTHVKLTFTKTDVKGIGSSLLGE